MELDTKGLTEEEILSFWKKNSSSDKFEENSVIRLPYLKSTFNWVIQKLQLYIDKLTKDDFLNYFVLLADCYLFEFLLIDSDKDADYSVGSNLVQTPGLKVQRLIKMLDDTYFPNTGPSTVNIKFKKFDGRCR